MTKPIHLRQFASRTRQWLIMALGFLMTFGLVLLSSLETTLNISGWSSGFIHPLHGGDHLLTMLAVGIWAAQLRGSAIWLLPLTFVGVMSLGGLAGAAGLLIPGAEPIILLSCLVFCVLIIRRIRFSNQTNLLIVAFFAFFHGFAHGQEISTSASLISYTLGFMVATLLLHGAGILVVRLLVVFFAFFISYLAHAQPTSDAVANKYNALTTSKEFISPSHSTLPDNQSYQNFLFIDENNTKHRLPKLDHFNIRPHSSEPANNYLTQAKDEISNIIFNAASYLAINHQTGIHFLTNGVGLTSPPYTLMPNTIPRFYTASSVCHASEYTAINGIQPLITRLGLKPPHFLYSPATSLLTNGKGATSPPFVNTFPAVTSFALNDIVFSNSFSVKNFIPLSSSDSNILFSNKSLAAGMQSYASLCLLLLPYKSHLTDKIIRQPLLKLSTIHLSRETT